VEALRLCAFLTFHWLSKSGLELCHNKIADEISSTPKQATVSNAFVPVPFGTTGFADGEKIEVSKDSARRSFDCFLRMWRRESVMLSMDKSPLPALTYSTGFC
jgi:hypothetical protein